jgi:hypothetical protein
MVDDSLKFVWAYMLENGKITDSKWNYYGGSWETPAGMGWREVDSAMTEIREKVLKVGIDWHRTISPETSLESEFNDTYSPSSEVPALLGSLYLKDGSVYTIGVKNAEERFQNYVKALRTLMEDKKRVKDILGE